jgi:transmembrane sensor
MNDNQRQNGSSGSPDAASWFVQLQRRPHDAELRSAFEDWLAADPRHAAEWAQVSSSWDRLDALKDDPQILAAREAMRAELAQAQRRRPQMRWAAGIVAIVVAGGAALGIGSWRQMQEQPAEMAVATATQALAIYKTPVGGQQTVTLQDGSKVTLSTDTEVQLTEWGERRGLAVTKGEAFFEVAKNPERPFVVAAAGRTVTALGTAFNVRVDPDQWSVGLVEGEDSRCAGRDVGRPPAGPESDPDPGCGLDDRGPRPNRTGELARRAAGVREPLARLDRRGNEPLFAAQGPDRRRRPGRETTERTLQIGRRGRLRRNP